MASTSNDNGRAFEYCLTKYILDNSSSKIDIDNETKNQQARDESKYENLSPELKILFSNASKRYFELLPTTIFSLKRLSDNEGKDGNPTDIELIFIENGLPKTK
ncbi:TPA: hypothetical protein O9V41_004931, partial [Escherichia coli]|nr:hypothetical protein [Escherichia coli]